MTISKFKLTNQRGGGGGAPVNAEFVTMALSGVLTDERVLTAGEGMDLTDGGAGGAATYKFETGIVYQKELHRETLAAAGNFDVQNIDQTYDHLILNLQLRSSVAATSDAGYMYLNNDTTNANYRMAAHFAGSAHGVDVQDYPEVAMVGNSAGADDFSSNTYTILNYAGSKRKNILGTLGQRRSAADIYVFQYFINWESTAAINRITIQPDGYAGDKLMIGSFLQLIGIKTAA